MFTNVMFYVVWAVLAFIFFVGFGSYPTNFKKENHCLFSYISCNFWNSYFIV